MGFVVKNTINFSILDLVCPHSCRGCGGLGGLLCERCKNYIKEGLSVVKKTDFEGLDVYLGPREGILFEMVKEYKYSSVRDLGRVLGELMAEEVVGVLPEEASEVVVVPLPTISKHVRERGFDHTWRLAKEVARRLKWVPDGDLEAVRGDFKEPQKGAGAAQLLAREGSSVQVGKEAEERERQAREAYRADFRAISRYVLGESKGKRGSKEGLGGSREDFEQPVVLLIDDVWTTGASMRAGVEILRGAGVKKIVTAVVCAGV